jgi:hypothetical protein
MYKNYEHFTEINNEEVEYNIESENLEDEEGYLDTQYYIDEEMIVEENDDIDEKIKNNEIIKLDDFDTTTDLLQKQIIKCDNNNNKKKHMKKSIEIIILVIIGLLFAVIAGAFLKHMKVVKKESLFEMVEPPKLY